MAAESASGCQVRPPSLVRAALWLAESGCRKSPPTAMPLSASRKAREKMPEDGVPLMTGVSLTSQLRPLSALKNTRAAVPPLAIHARPSAPAIRQLPLAAKAYSPSCAGGIWIRGTSSQVCPASEVR